MTHAPNASPDEHWYAVKCIFSHPSRVSDAETHLFEERMTLWRAESFEQAFALAEAEARVYASQDCIFIRAVEAFLLTDGPIGHGSEVWSQMRGTHLEAELYIQTFCSTSRDRATYIDDKEGAN